jgi:coenzyme F420-0:L-glutamate ligase/coenzyme F420-1:gamma-L-glutamate ligase
VPQIQKSKFNRQDTNHHETSGVIEIIPILGFPIVELGNDIAQLILDAIRNGNVEIKKGDIIVVSHNVVSIAEKSVVESKNITVTPRARRVALSTQQKPQKVQVALDEASDILIEDVVLITRTSHGIITDMSGVDESNAPPGYYVTLPSSPDASAERISKALTKEFGFRIPVIIADTQGRPWRRGAVNLAIGIAAMSPFTENADKRDLYGRQLRSSRVCLADEIAAAAELVMGQADEGIPVAIARGISSTNENGSANQIIRDKDSDLFR